MGKLNKEEKKDLVRILGFYIHSLLSDVCALENKIRLVGGVKGAAASCICWEDKIDKQDAYAKKLEKLRNKIKEWEVSDE